MNRPRLLPILILTTALTAGWTSLSAQNRIIAAPDAVELRKVWEREGRWGLDAEYGWRMWGGTDISGDGIADFGVYQREGEYANTWHFYRGGDPVDTAAYWRMSEVGSNDPCVGRFFGDDRLMVLFLSGYRAEIDNFYYYYDRVHLYQILDSGVSAPPLIDIDQGQQTPPIERGIRRIVSVDVNNDEIDDICMILSGKRVGQDRAPYDHRGQIWIYYGGPDFQLDSPSVIIYDTLENGSNPDFQYNVHIRDFDGDGLVDMMTSADYEGVGGLVRFRWGDDQSPESWQQRPFDRDISYERPNAGLENQFFSPYYHLDTAPGLDFVSIVGNDDGSSSALLFLSGSASIRTRSFTRADADREFILPENFDYGRATTSLNNTAYGLDMLPFDRPPWFSTPGALIFLSGGSSGPDSDYEARISERAF